MKPNRIQFTVSSVFTSAHRTFCIVAEKISSDDRGTDKPVYVSVVRNGVCALNIDEFKTEQKQKEEKIILKYATPITLVFARPQRSTREAVYLSFRFRFDV